MISEVQKRQFLHYLAKKDYVAIREVMGYQTKPRIIGVVPYRADLIKKLFSRNIVPESLENAIYDIDQSFYYRMIGVVRKKYFVDCS